MYLFFCRATSLFVITITIVFRFSIQLKMGARFWGNLAVRELNLENLYILTVWQWTLKTIFLFVTTTEFRFSGGIFVNILQHIPTVQYCVMKNDY